jgi:TonB family protein
MTPGLLWDDLLAYSLQVGLLVGVGAAIPMLFRIRVPRAKLLFWQILLAACVGLPWVRAWKQEIFVTAVRQIEIVAQPGQLAPAPDAPRSIPFMTIALGLLAAGALFRMGSLCLGMLRLRAYRKHGKALARGLRMPGTPNHVEILLSNDVRSPVTFGWRAPAILLPAIFPSLSAGMREAILCHELVHVERRDWLFTLGEELVRAALWFHPAIWWVIGEIHLSREQAVDESVLEMTEAQEPYMDALLAMAGVATSGTELAPAPMFLRKRHLKQRLMAMMKEVRMKRVSGMRLACTMSAAMVALVCAGWLATGIFPLAAAPRFGSDGAGVFVNTGHSHLLHRAPVPYPPDAQTKGIEGTVVAQLQLDANGEVADASILSGPRELRKAVLESVLGWHFEKGDASTVPTVSVRFEKAAPAPPARELAVAPAPRPRPVAAAKIRHIVISGLPDEMRNELRSKLSVHEGDEWSPAALNAARETASNFDSHLRTTLSRNSQRNFDIVIDLPPGVGVATSGDVMHAGNGITPPILISKVEPQYTEEARAARYSGSVLLSVVVGPDGRAGDCKVIRSLGMGLDEKAIEAVRRWQFRPGTNAGVPVNVQAQIEVNFRLL